MAAELGFLFCFAMLQLHSNGMGLGFVGLEFFKGLVLSNICALYRSVSVQVCPLVLEIQIRVVSFSLRRPDFFCI